MITTEVLYKEMLFLKATHLKKKMMTAALALTLFATPVQAKEVTHRVLKALKNSGADVFYLGAALDLDGWVIVSKNGAVSYAYTNAQGGLMNGFLFDEAGQAVTVKQIDALKTDNTELLARIEAAIQSRIDNQAGTAETSSASQPQNTETTADDTVPMSAREEQEAVIKNGEVPEIEQVKNSPKAEKAYHDVEQSSWISYGDKNAPYIYAFVNPTCPHCVDFLTQDIKSFVDNGQLQVRFVPYGVSKENTETTVAMLAVEDPMTAWTNYIAGDKEALSVKLGTKDSVKKARANTKLAAEMRFTALPFIIYRTPSTGEIQIVNGRPENMMLLMSEFIQ